MCQNNQQPNKIKLTSILFFQPKTPQQSSTLKLVKNKQVDQNGNVKELCFVLLHDNEENRNKKEDVVNMLGVQSQQISNLKVKENIKDKPKQKGRSKENIQWEFSKVQVFNQPIGVHYGFRCNTSNKESIDLYQSYSNIVTLCPKLPHTKSTIILNDISTPISPEILTNFIQQFNKSKTLTADEKQSLFIVVLPTKTIIDKNKNNNDVHISTSQNSLEVLRSQQRIQKIFQIAKMNDILFVELIDNCQIITHNNNSNNGKQLPKPNNIFQPAYQLIFAWRSLLQTSKSPCSSSSLCSTIYKTYLKIMLKTIQTSKLRIQQLQKITSSEVYQVMQIWVSKIQELYTIVRDIVGLFQQCVYIVKQFCKYIRNKQQLGNTRGKIEEFRAVLAVFQEQNQDNKGDSKENNDMKSQIITNNNKQQAKTKQNKQKLCKIISKLQQKCKQLQQRVDNDNKNIQQTKQKLSKAVKQFTQKTTNILLIYKEYSKDLKKQKNKKDQLSTNNNNSNTVALQKQKEKENENQQTEQILMKSKNNIQNQQNQYEDQRIGNKVVSQWEKQLQRKLKNKMKLQTKQLKMFIQQITQTQQLIVKVMKSQEQMQVYQIIPQSVEVKPLNILINFFITKKFQLFASQPMPVSTIPQPIPLSSNLVVCNELSSTILQPPDNPTLNSKIMSNVNYTEISQQKQLQLGKSISCPEPTIKSKLISTIADNNVTNSVVQASAPQKQKQKNNKKSINKNTSNVSVQQNVENQYGLNSQQAQQNMNNILSNIQKMQQSICHFRVNKLMNYYDGLEYNKFLLKVTENNFRIFQNKQAEIKQQSNPRKPQQSLINTKKKSSKVLD